MDMGRSFACPQCPGVHALTHSMDVPYAPVVQRRDPEPAGQLHQELRAHAGKPSRGAGHGAAGRAAAAAAGSGGLAFHLPLGRAADLAGGARQHQEQGLPLQLYVLLSLFCPLPSCFPPSYTPSLFIFACLSSHMRAGCTTSSTSSSPTICTNTHTPSASDVDSQAACLVLEDFYQAKAYKAQVVWPDPDVEPLAAAAAAASSSSSEAPNAAAPPAATGGAAAAGSPLRQHMSYDVSVCVCMRLQGGGVYVCVRV